MLHQVGTVDKLLILPRALEYPEFMETRGHRAIGVVYHPQREYYGNYVPTVLPERYDAFMYIDETHALYPLHLEPHNTEMPPETFPWGV